MKGILSIICAAALAAAAGRGVAAETSGGYAEDLSRVYEATQFIQAVKEGCDTALPDTRPANEAAYGAWRKRHQSLLDELEKRFIALIRGASTDQMEYSKNVGKYAGDALHHIEEIRKEFLAQGTEEIGRQCREYPEFLKGKDADLRKRYATELKSIRRRKL